MSTAGLPPITQAPMRTSGPDSGPGFSSSVGSGSGSGAGAGAPRTSDSDSRPSSPDEPVIRIQKQLDGVNLDEEGQGLSGPGPTAGTNEATTAPGGVSGPSGGAPGGDAGASGPVGGPPAAPASSQHLLEDPKLKEIMLSDVGTDALLARLKQSIVSTREFAAFVKRQAQLESEHQAATKKASRNYRETLRRAEGRQGTFARQVDDIIRMNERTSDVGNTFVAALHIMHDELAELAKSTDRSRKSIKETCLRNEKNALEAEQVAEKAQAKYDQLAEEYERMRTGDPTKNKFGFKQSRTAQHEEELHRKVVSAEGDYQQRVTNAQRLRQELVNKLRPVSVRELRQLTAECDSGLALQLQKYSNLNETRALNSGFIIAPLTPQGSATAPLSMKQLASKVDNDLDFYNYVLAAGKGKSLNRRGVKYRQHPSLATAYPTPIGSTNSSGGGGLSKTTSGIGSVGIGAAAGLGAGAAAAGGAALSSVRSATTSPPLRQSTSPVGNADSPVITAGSPAFGTSVNSAGGGTLDPGRNVSGASSALPGGGAPSIDDYAARDGPGEYPPGTSSSTLPSYGTQLEELLDYEQGTVPRVVYQCVQAIDSFGLEVEGIYRANGNSKQVTEIKRLFDADSAAVNLLRPNPHLNDIHAVASALKLYFNDLPDPLLTSEFHSEFIEGVKVEHDVQRRDAIHSVINKLPDPNYTTLRYLVFHLYRVQEREAINRMSIVNLGIVWGPVLMAVDYQNVEEMATVGKIVETILLNAYVIFDAE